MSRADPASGAAGQPAPRTRRPQLSLFWRTWLMLVVLIFISSLAWLQVFRTQEYEPRILRNAHQIATVVNLTKTALIHSDAIARVSLLKSLADEEDVSIQTREPGDRFVVFGDSAVDKRLVQEMIHRLGPDTVVASKVNDEPGLWVGFKIERDSYWLQMDPARLRPLGGSAWLTWLAVTLALSLAGAGMVAGLIHRPLQRLSWAANRVRDGHYSQAQLDENAATSEIREVNMGFNRMVQRLAKIDQDRTLMLAGISHDLRTPLARLRLETELSVSHPATRDLMAADIAQLDAIIDKFLDYARPGPTELGPVWLSGVISTCLTPWRHEPRLEVRVDVPENLHIHADPVELSRVLSNLLENAHRYGQSPDDGISRVDIVARVAQDGVVLDLADHGPGVSDAALQQLTQAFFRGDAARTAATGSGLGLAIVERAVERMGGQFCLAHRQGGGLLARMTFKASTPN